MSGFIKMFRSYWVRDASFISLFVMLLVVTFILPAFMAEKEGLSTLHTMLLIIYFVGIWSADNRALIILSTALFLIQLILMIIRYGELGGPFPALEYIFGSLNIVVFCLINFRLLFRDAQINFERVLGAVNVYLLIALWGAFMFELIAILHGSALEGNVDIAGDDYDFAQYIYFSLVSLTTVGFGDIFPANHTARMLSVFLSSIGILFPAVIIARLVSASVTGYKKEEQN